MRFLKNLLLLAFLLVGGLYIYGMTLPREHSVASTITLVTPPESVFAVVRDIGGSASWWSDVKSVRRLGGKTRESWEQETTMGVLQVEVTSAAPPAHLVTTILNDNQQDFGGKWTYDISATGAGTEVTITEDGWVATPFFKVVSKMMGHHRTIDSHLTSLAARFGETASPRHRN